MLLEAGLDELVEATKVDTPGYDVEKWEAKHNKTFYLRYIPSDVLREEIFTYLNCSWKIDRDILDNSKWCKRFRTTCKEFANSISMKDCVSGLIIGNARQTIDLKENDIENIESFRYLKCLILYYVNFNRLPRCNNLKVLEINNSNLTELSISPKVQLKKLGCYNCKNLKSIPEDLNDSLEVLHLIGCTKITVLPDHLINLIFLDISETSVDAIPKTFVNLEYLDVNHQIITSIPKELVNLKTLYVNDQITSIPKELVNLTEGNALELPRV